MGDCARGNLLAIQKKSGSGIYNLGYGRGSTINEIFTLLKAATGYPLDAQYGPAKLGETRRIFLDASKAGRELGWEPTVPLEEGLARTVDYFRTVETVA